MGGSRQESRGGEIKDVTQEQETFFGEQRLVRIYFTPEEAELIERAHAIRPFADKVPALKISLLAVAQRIIDGHPEAQSPSSGSEAEGL